jgi:adenosylhomocysteine nucleosidase
MIGIIGAMPDEVRHVVDRMAHCVTETISGMPFHKGVLFDAEVVAAVSGIGKVHAAMCAQTMILKYAPHTVINTGVAGGLADFLVPGDIVIATALVQHDIDHSGFGDPIGLIPGLEMLEIPCSSHLVRRFRSLSENTKEYGVYAGKIATGDQAVFDRTKSEWIRKQFDALAIDEEGGSIAQVCCHNGVDFCEIRSISDNAGAGAQLTYFENKQLAARRPSELVMQYIKQL